MRQLHPSFRSTATARSLCCRGRLQPTPLSRSYNVMITCEPAKLPAARVAGLHPRADAARIPHTYEPVRPCLFYPKAGEWRSDMKIATSIVPWLSLWLYYYEVWHATGDWMGGGIEHCGASK
jgi:hypothetical protein